MKQFIQDFCDSQGDNYSVGLHHGDSEITVRGGEMSREEWEDVATELISALIREYGREYGVYSCSKNEFILTNK